MRRCLAWTALAVFLLTAGCGGGEEFNQTLLTGNVVSVGNGAVRSWGLLDTKEKPAQLNVSFSTGAVLDLPTEINTWALAVPSGLNCGYTHLVLQWLPAGRKGGTAYAAPMFALHGFTIPNADRLLIDADDPEMYVAPPADRMPAGFSMTAGSGTDDIGAYWDHDVPAAPAGEGPFGHDFTFGSYDGKAAFTGFLVGPDFLASRTPIDVQIPLPAQVSRTGWYPTRLQIVVEEGRVEYTLTFSDFVFRTAPTG
ncbi:MAG: hypothetical protein KIS66_01680 [Fimbriimonadaceae bacterium]|nr:hypothetical protein [Fimbriimonadaceae bacterium]